MEQVKHTLQRSTIAGLTVLLIATGGAIISGCARHAPTHTTPVLEGGRDLVRIEQSPQGAAVNSHPVKLTPNEIATLLRGIRVWERRNAIHELLVGEADKKRAFREDDIAVLAPAIAKALEQAGPADRVYFHLSDLSETGDEETTSGWVYVQEPLFNLVLTEVHDKHGPRPDISKYDRQLPNIPELSGPFNVTFEPEEYLARVVSTSPWFSPEQQEDLQIEFRKALPVITPSSVEPANPGESQPRP